MSDTTISLDWIGGQLRAIQAEQRTIRAENEILRSTLLSALGDVVRVLSDRIANFEALLEARVDRLEAVTLGQIERLETVTRERADQLETTITARFDRIEAMLKPSAPSRPPPQGGPR